MHRPHPCRRMSGRGTYEVRTLLLDKLSTPSSCGPSPWWAALRTSSSITLFRTALPWPEISEHDLPGVWVTCSIKEAAAVPLLCRYHGAMVGRQCRGRVSGGRHLQPVNISNNVTFRRCPSWRPVCGELRSLRRRPVGCPGSHHDVRLRGYGTRRPHRHGHRLGATRWTNMIQPLLGLCRSGYRQAVRPGHHGYLVIVTPCLWAWWPAWASWPGPPGSDLLSRTF